MKKFVPISISSKFGICGLPIRGDSYRGCTFNCEYCFAKERVIMQTSQDIETADLDWMKRKLKRVFEGKIDDNNFLDRMIKERITWHWGGMSDPFQPCESVYRISHSIPNITDTFGISILFSTKTDKIDIRAFRPDLHTFQLSVTSSTKNPLELNVPDINSRIALFDNLKNNGFRVGIRVQPFIPNISDASIVDLFSRADYFTVEGLKIVPQNKEQISLVTEKTGIPISKFVNLGLYNLNPDVRKNAYAEIIRKFELYNIPYSIADNDMHYITSSKCCCGEPLVSKSTDFNNTALFFKYGKDYTKKDIDAETECYGECKTASLFASNRQEGSRTIREYFNTKIYDRDCPCSKYFMYGLHDDKQQELFV